MNKLPDAGEHGDAFVEALDAIMPVGQPGHEVAFSPGDIHKYGGPIPTLQGRISDALEDAARFADFHARYCRTPVPTWIVRRVPLED